MTKQRRPYPFSSRYSKLLFSNRPKTTLSILFTLLQTYFQFNIKAKRFYSFSSLSFFTFKQNRLSYPKLICNNEKDEQIPSLLCPPSFFICLYSCWTGLAATALLVAGGNRALSALQVLCTLYLSPWNREIRRQHRFFALV
jgi:hypothetical protein